MKSLIIQCRVNYDNKSWGLIGNKLMEDHTAIPALQRASVICDVADLARTGYVTEVPINPFSITFMVPSPGDPDHGVGIQGIGKGLWGLVGF